MNKAPLSFSMVSPVVMAQPLSNQISLLVLLHTLLLSPLLSPAPPITTVSLQKMNQPTPELALMKPSPPQAVQVRLQLFHKVISKPLLTWEQHLIYWSQTTPALLSPFPRTMLPKMPSSKLTSSTKKQSSWRQVYPQGMSRPVSTSMS